MTTAEGLRRAGRGLSEAAFRERFGTEEACRRALFERRWREGLTCPACGHHGFCALKTRRLFQCNRFRNGPLGVKPFTAFAHRPSAICGRSSCFPSAIQLVS